VSCDLTGTRVTGLLSSGYAVIVVGAQKIVKNYEDAIDRMYHYQLPLESARARIAYPGVKGSNPNNIVAIRGANPFGPPRVHVIIVGEALGF